VTAVPPSAIHLVLGHAHDPFCAGVLARLRRDGLRARLITSVFAAPTRLEWRLDEHGVQSRLTLEEGEVTVASVLVRDAGWLDPAEWRSDDHAYMQAEVQAALLAWLAGLDCPVVNRACAERWYRPRMPMLAWQPLLQRAGLPTADAIFTNDPSRARAFGRRLAEDGVHGVVFTSLASDAAWLVGETDWPGLAALQALAPVCVSEPHRAPLLACVVGNGIVWDGSPPPQVAALAPALRAFAHSAGLDFVEVAVAAVRRGPAVVRVEPRVDFEHFSAPTRERILDALVDVLVAKPARAHRTAEALP
jgi:hypothetical protein